MRTGKEKTRQIVLIILGIFIVLLSVLSITYAYFTANDVEGNSTTNTVEAETADYGHTTVIYDQDNGILSTGILDLLSSEAGTDYQFLLKFRVETTATIDLDLNINWKDITNTFCQYRNSQICTNDPGDTLVTGEIVYDLYSCDTAGYTETVASAENKSVTLGTTCTKISSETSGDVPTTGNTEMLNTAPHQLLANSINYYAIILTVKNTNDPQNYNQAKNFNGQVNVSIATI